ncbi:Uncharacterised protein [Stenotrophomonas maltophilia]|nr:Uncharacterised protein [Stenotrophomonas maltophilia]
MSALGAAGADCTLAVDFESAESAIRSREFDLYVLDLKIPSRSNSLDAKAENGQALYGLICKESPGTPIRVLTSSEPGKFLRKLVSFGEMLDIWGSGDEIPLIGYFDKEEATELIDQIREYSGIIAATDSIPLNSRGIKLDLSQTQQRAIRSFVRSVGGTSCDLRKLAGLSGSVVMRIVVKDSKGRTLSEVVGKIGNRLKVEREITAYNGHVKNLKIGLFAHIVSQQNKGLHQASSVFYRLADSYDRTFFEVANEDPKLAAKVVSEVRKGLETWSNAREQVNVKVQEIRSSLIQDNIFKPTAIKTSLQSHEVIEDNEIAATRSCCHGDLHGANILVANNGSAVIIDYGDVGSSFSCLDPITLELSLIFHPDASEISSELSPLLHNWGRQDLYTEGNRFKPLIDACRDWAYDVAGGDLAVLAVAYSFVARQLKFDTVDKSVTVALATSLLEQLRESH